MSKDAVYLSKLNTLLEAYDTELIAGLLGVTGRSIQNYTSVNPTTPHKSTLRKLDEIFAKHSKGERLDVTETKNPDRVDQDYKDKYITLLESRVKELEGISPRLTAIETAISEVKRSQQIMYSAQLAYHDTTLPLLSKGKDILQDYGKRVRAYLVKFHKGGIEI